MSRYQHPTSRTAFGLAALALTAITLALAVVAPANMETRSPDFGTLASAKAVRSTPIEVLITPARIDVVGEREQKTAFGPEREARSPRKLPG